MSLKIRARLGTALHFDLSPDNGVGGVGIEGLREGLERQRPQLHSLLVLRPGSDFNPKAFGTRSFRFQEQGVRLRRELTPCSGCEAQT